MKLINGERKKKRKKNLLCIPLWLCSHRLCQSRYIYWKPSVECCYYPLRSIQNPRSSIQQYLVNENCNRFNSIWFYHNEVMRELIRDNHWQNKITFLVVMLQDLGRRTIWQTHVWPLSVMVITLKINGNQNFCSEA